MVRKGMVDNDNISDRCLLKYDPQGQTQEGMVVVVN